MIPNLHSLAESPVARTNMIRLEAAPLDTVRCLLAPVSYRYAVDFVLRPFPRGRKEKSRAYNARVHREVKADLRRTLGLEPSEDVKYELHRLGRGQYLFFYLAPAVAPRSPAHESLPERIEQLCQRLTADDIGLERLIQGLFGLHLKMLLLEQAEERFEVPPVYFNAVMYLNARLSRDITKQHGTGVMEAFELDVFASRQQELVFMLHRRCFRVEPADELHLALDDDSVWFNVKSRRVKARQRLDARRSKLDFFLAGSRYASCQAYTYNVVMNAVQKRLHELEIPHAPVAFQATHEVNQFVTDLDRTLAHSVRVVNNGVNFSAEQEAGFFDALAAVLPGCRPWPLAELEEAARTGFFGLPAGTSVLVLNPVHGEAENSIRRDDDPQAEYTGFFAAYDADKKSPGAEWDTYTRLKLDRLRGWLAEAPLPVVLQGINVDEPLLKALDTVGEHKAAGPISHKLRRTKTELWFKEILLARRSIPLPGLFPGRYTAFSVRVTENRTMLLGHVTLEVNSDRLTVVDAGVIEGDKEWLQVEHPALARLDKLYNHGFYLYDHAADALLTAYNSLRVPRLIGPAQMNVVDLYAYQQEEKSRAKRDGRPFKEYTITRSAAPERNVLPYLLAPGRSTRDPLSKPKYMKHHHAYLQPHEQGLYLLVSNAQPADQSMARPNLVENLLIWDAQGHHPDVFTHSLAGVYLNSFTLDMLRSGNSSKRSMFAKLARLMVEN